MIERTRNGKTYTTGQAGDLHDSCIIAAHKESGKMFGGKGKGTHIGYSQIGHLKAAMTHAGIKDKSEYYFIKLSFNEVEGQLGAPTITLLEEK